jgi:hypothetical protein
LAEKLTGNALKFKANATFKIQQVENISKALQAFKDAGVNVAGVGNSH